MKRSVYILAVFFCVLAYSSLLAQSADLNLLGTEITQPVLAGGKVFVASIDSPIASLTSLIIVASAPSRQRLSATLTVPIPTSSNAFRAITSFPNLAHKTASNVIAKSRIA